MVNPDHGPEPADEEPDGAEGDLAADLLARLGGAGGQPPPGRRRTGPARRSRQRTDPPEPEYSGPGPGGRDPVTAGDAVQEVVAAQGWKRNTQLAAAMARWDDIAGPEVAAHVVAESFTDGVLTLRADSTAWATQLRMLLPTLRHRIDAAVGQGVVADINVKGPDAPRQRGSWRVPGRGPRDTYG
ncbi:MAG: DUF721 domain-containing protein [Actinobacteria bacterium]|nr:DUF721 domain-containing protein [Actinomycetota bacterium]MCB9411535.1 DUF721 domain-containing protein [Actinomycetota bacterium]